MPATDIECAVLSMWAAAQDRDPDLARRFVFVTGGAYTTGRTAAGRQA